jgi:hypothetical protein
MRRWTLISPRAIRWIKRGLRDPAPRLSSLWSSLQGCYGNVVGLPLCHIQRLLRRLGIEPQAEAILTCSSTLPHECEIAGQVLSGL